MPNPLSERDWRDLLRLIHDRQVIPVVGPCLVTVIDPATDERVPLHRHLAPALARGHLIVGPEGLVAQTDPRRVRGRLPMSGGVRQQASHRLGFTFDRL